MTISEDSKSGLTYLGVIVVLFIIGSQCSGQGSNVDEQRECDVGYYYSGPTCE